MTELKLGRGARPLWRLLVMAVIASAGLLGCTSLSVSNDLTLQPAVSGERREVTRRAGRLSYYVAGQGPPVLLVHSINAAGSAYEVRPIFEHLRRSRRVYAPDLPGFGFSDRSERRYDAPLYVDAVHDMLDVIRDDAGPAPIDALALSLSSEFLARAATDAPDRLRALTLVTPTGFSSAYNALRGPEDATREIPGLYRFFTFPLWSQPFYDLLVSQWSIRFFLKRTFGSDRIDEGLAAYDYVTAHQPGAKNAPYAFVSGRLFSKDIRSVYERLELPVWMPHGTRGDFKDFTVADWAKARPNWTVQPYDTGALPHFEVPDAFLRDLDRFLAPIEREPAGVYASPSEARSPSP